jgi:hypothetical protein
MQPAITVTASQQTRGALLARRARTAASSAFASTRLAVSGSRGAGSCGGCFLLLEQRSRDPRDGIVSAELAEHDGAGDDEQQQGRRSPERP